jgi:hypothetical protein
MTNNDVKKPHHCPLCGNHYFGVRGHKRCYGPLYEKNKALEKRRMEKKKS